MNSLIDGIRAVIGVPQFYVNGAIDYGAVTEYFVAAVILMVVISSIFKILVRWFDK